MNRAMIYEYLSANPDSTCRQICDHFNHPRNGIGQILKYMEDAGVIRKTKCDDGFFRFSIIESFTYGCANPLTAFINQRLREVRSQ